MTITYTKSKYSDKKSKLTTFILSHHWQAKYNVMYSSYYSLMDYKYVQREPAIYFQVLFGADKLILLLHLPPKKNIITIQIQRSSSLLY